MCSSRGRLQLFIGQERVQQEHLYEAYPRGDLCTHWYVDVKVLTCSATNMNQNFGLLGCSPTHWHPGLQNGEAAAPATTWLFTLDEISQLDLRKLKLLILSGGQSVAKIPEDAKVSPNFHAGHLTKAFLHAGVQNILQLQWPVPNVVMTAFFQTFYDKLLTNYTVLEAFKAAINDIDARPE
ncbi:hypothetical protein Ciccas_009461 [Cichlidogyrus casuarinus]|uniref:CHAT domain-containing protein n=1 Tax=Cichlidogyrus casuarinus TaxID=1844966 RepID=A0ABD2PXY0_9PLAT